MIPEECPTCGAAVRVVSSGEGTSYYQPLVPTADLDRLRAALDAADDLSKHLRAWVQSGLQPEDWPKVQAVGIRYQEARAALGDRAAESGRDDG